MPPPSVDALARSLAPSGLPHPVLVDVARAAIAAAGRESTGAPTPEAVQAHVERLVSARQQSLLQPVINATGVLLHTNMGRAPFGTSTDPSFWNLELDLTTGQRGSRQSAVGKLFAQLCGAEAALVVNNCAAAVTLSLAALAQGRGVAVSRSELVEIGGGFRVPEVMEQSGAKLVEIGTTNRTRRADFEKVITNPELDVALALKVHQSNYKIIGFTEEVHVRDLGGIGVPVLADIGSGLLDAACPWLPGGPPAWLADEPAAKQTLADGADLVMFSGDKLLGGPQAGIIAGSADLVAQCARHPLARAFRPGGLILQQLQALALTYLNRDGDSIAFWRMASESPAVLEQRAQALGVGTPTPMTSVPGGGTLPSVEIPSFGVTLDGDHTAALRTVADTPIIARVNDNITHLDLRTIEPAHDALVADAVRQVLAAAPASS